LTGEINYQFQPYDVHALDGIGTVYGTLRATGPWGVIECPGGALMTVGRRKMRSVHVSAPDPLREQTADAIEGDGWTLRLGRGYILARGRRDGDWIVMREQ
ncbi:MAG: hypothetical protein GY711_12550, partial [bacterium]|nr:hypothetical protein [bacterium]